MNFILKSWILELVFDKFYWDFWWYLNMANIEDIFQFLNMYKWVKNKIHYIMCIFVGSLYFKIRRYFDNSIYDYT